MRWIFDAERGLRRAPVGGTPRAQEEHVVDGAYDEDCCDDEEVDHLLLAKGHTDTYQSDDRRYRPQGHAERARQVGLAYAADQC